MGSEMPLPPVKKYEFQQKSKLYHSYMGMVNDYVEKKRWVGGQKMFIFVRIKNVCSGRQVVKKGLRST